MKCIHCLFTETLGFVVLEAMASGIPVVGVAAGGLVDIIENDKTGFLVANNDDMVEFSEKTSLLIQNVELRKQFGLNARKWAEGWSWETATSKLRNIQYRLAIKLHKARDVVSNDHVDEIEQVDVTLPTYPHFISPHLQLPKPLTLIHS